MIKNNKYKVLYDTLHIREKAKMEISDTFLRSMDRTIEVQEITDEDITVLDKFNLTYNPFSGKLEECW